MNGNPRRTFCLSGHGGFGTAFAGLRAGIRAQVIPHIADQFYWGQHLHQLGVGVPFIPRPQLNREGWVAALKELTHNDSRSAEASALGVRIRAENGIDNAVRLIEEIFN